MPDINFKIVGHYLKTFQKATNDWREVVKHYRIARIHTIIDKTTEHIMQDKEDILNDLKSELGEVYEYVIMKLIAGEQPDHAEMLKQTEDDNEAPASPPRKKPVIQPIAKQNSLAAAPGLHSQHSV
jgi:hypothetical protein